MGKGQFLGEFEQIVLLAVTRLKGDGYGATIRQEVESRTGREVSVGAIHATLDRLEGKTYLQTRSGDPSPERGGRPKRFFRLTPAGAKALEASRQMHDVMWEGLDPKGSVTQE